MQPFWLDAVCQNGEIWGAVMVFDAQGKVEAAHTYCWRKKWGFPVVVMPPLTPFAGPWLRYPKTDKLQSRHSFEKEVLKKLVAQLPNVFYSSQSFHFSLTNWLPFYWAGYQATPRYTYVIEDLSDLSLVFNNMKSVLRNTIRKAEKLVIVEKSESLSDFYAVNKKTFERQNKVIPYSFSFLEKIDNQLKNKGLRTIYLAKDKLTNEIHGGVYVAKDAQTAYALLIGSDPKLRESGAVSLLLWHALQDASPSLHFDFEGSMMGGVESLFSSFGAAQKPYFIIHKCKNKWVEIARLFLLKK